jgi:hypothetical protein
MTNNELVIPEDDNSEHLPVATHFGNLKIGDITLPCAVLEDDRRVLTRAAFIKALGRTGKAKGGRDYDDDLETPVFVTAQNLQPYIPGDLLSSETAIRFRRGKQVYIGYEAELLPKICYVFIDAEDAGALTLNQKAIAKQCRILVRGFATVGVIALIDEATGYQYERDRNALHKILEAYIAKELLPWTRRFPNEFYQEMFRLRNWQYNPLSVAKPRIVGKLTNEIVYKRLPSGVLEELQRQNPPVTEDGYRKYKHHQFLTEDIGNPHLEKHLAVVIALMRASTTWRKFEALLERAVPRAGRTMPLPFPDDDDDD